MAGSVQAVLRQKQEVTLSISVLETPRLRLRHLYVNDIEAAQALKLYGFTHLQANRLIALIAPANVASQRVALKIGMHYERDWVDWKGRAKHIYSITSEA